MCGFQKAIVYTLVVMFVFSLKPQQSVAREWTDVTGKFKTEAEFVDFKDGVVRIKKTTGATISVPINRLSPADQAYVKRIVTVARDQSAVPVPTPADASPARPSEVLKLKVWLSGEDDLLIQGNRVWFKHYRGYRPGEVFSHNSCPHPPTVNGQIWPLRWKGFNDSEPFEVSGFMLPKENGLHLELRGHVARGLGHAHVREQPCASNDFTAKVFMNGEEGGAGTWYEFEFGLTKPNSAITYDGDKRTYHFPKDSALGTVVTGLAGRGLKSMGPAQGDVVIEDGKHIVGLDVSGVSLEQLRQGLEKVKAFPPDAFYTIMMRGMELDAAAGEGLAHFRLLRELSLRDCVLTPDALASLDGHKGLSKLNLIRARTREGQNLPPVPKLPNLTEFNAVGAPYDDSELANLAGCPFLDTLLLGGSHISGSLLSELACGETLVRLSINHVGPFQIENLKYLPRFKSLEVLNLNGLSLTEQSVVYVSMLPKIRELCMQDRGISIEDEWLVHFRAHKALADLRIESLAFTGSGLAYLNPKMIKRLDLWGTSVDDAGAENIVAFNSLRHLEVHDTKITEKGLLELANVLRGCDIKHPDMDKVRQHLPPTYLVADFTFDDDGEGLEKTGRVPVPQLENASWHRGALFLDGSYSLDSPPLLDLQQLDTKQFTLAMAFYPVEGEWARSRGGHLICVGKDSRSFVMREKNGVLEASIGNFKKVFPLDGPTLTTGQWHSIICALDHPGRRLRIIIDGKMLPEITLPDDTPKPRNENNINLINTGTGEVFTGYWDRFRVYSGAMTTEDMESLYAKLKPELPTGSMPDAPPGFLEAKIEAMRYKPDVGELPCETVVIRNPAGMLHMHAQERAVGLPCEPVTVVNAGMQEHEEKTMNINVASLRLAGGLSRANELVLFANPGKNFEVEVTVAYKTPVPTKIAANLGVNETLLWPEAIQLLREKHGWTRHFDTESRLGYSSAEGEGTMTFTLIGFAPREKGRYPMNLQVGLFDKATWRTKLDRRYPIVLVTDPVELRLATKEAPALTEKEVEAFLALVEKDDVAAVQERVAKEPLLAVAFGSPKRSGQSALFHVRSVEMADALLEAGARMDVTDIYGLLPVFTVGEGVGVHLLSKGAPFGDLNSALARAAESGTMDLVQYFVEKGADVNWAPQWKLSILETAALNGQGKVVGYLVDNGAALEGNTGTRLIANLLRTRKDQSSKMLALLADKGLNLNPRDEKGNTLLPWIFITWDPDTLGAILPLLEKHGVDVNVADAKGRKPLYWAIRSKKTESVILLLERGANPHAPCGDGLTPLAWAEKCGSPEIVKLLKAQGP